MHYEINRRDLLRMTTGVATAPGVANAVNTEELDGDPVRLIEMGIEYELEGEGPFWGTHVGGDPKYFLDEDRVVIPPSLPDEVERRFVKEDGLVGAQDVHTLPVRLSGAGPARKLTTRLVNSRRPVERVQLNHRHSPPEVEIRDRPGNVTAIVEGERHLVRPGDELSVQLPTETVEALVRIETDETLDVSGVPDHRVSNAVEFDHRTVGATPTVTVKDQGKLEVFKINEIV